MGYMQHFHFVLCETYLGYEDKQCSICNSINLNSEAISLREGVKETLGLEFVVIKGLRGEWQILWWIENIVIVTRKDNMGHTCQLVVRTDGRGGVIRTIRRMHHTRP